MKQGDITVRQYLILLSVGLMPALVKLVPGHQAVRAGRSAWLGPLAALGPLLLAVWIIERVGERLPEGSGLGELYLQSFGRRLGRLVCGLCGVWLLVVGCFALRFCGERFLSTLYPDTGLELFFLTLTALVWWLGRKELAATARAGQMFFYGITAVLVLILALVAGEVRLYKLWPVWVEDTGAVLRSGGEVVNTLSLGAGTLFLFQRTGARRGAGALARKWVALLCVLLTVLAVEVLGTFGAPLAGRMQIPFFSLAKEVKPERLESIVAAAWVFADVILLSLLLRSAHCALELAAQRPLPRLNAALALVLLPGGYLVAQSTFTLEKVYDCWESVGKNLIFLALPLAAAAVGRLRGRL